MGAYESSARLSKAIRELLLHWNEAQAAWNDPVSHRFEESWIVPLQSEVRNAASAMSDMATLLDRIRRDCS
jgi:hypothetical protein